VSRPAIATMLAVILASASARSGESSGTGVKDKDYREVVVGLAVGDADSDLAPREAFAEANRAYRAAAQSAGEARKVLYREAARRYAGLARRHPNGYVLYNLGNARFRAGEFGGAIAAYRRAADFLPRHAATRRNLALARDTAPGGRQGIVAEPHPAAAAFFFWHYGLSLAEAEKLAAFFFLALLGLLAARLFAGPPLRRRLRPAAIACGALALAMALSSTAKLAWSSEKDAVVVASEARVRSEPAGRAVELFILREGAEVRVLGRSGAWSRVLAGADRRGWVESETIERLAAEPRLPGRHAATRPKSR